jgi:MFS family permease
MITIAAVLGTLLIPLNGTSITVAAKEIATRFDVSDSPFPNTYWTVTSWSLGGSIFIIVGLPLMEDLGVRLGFLGFYAFFFLMIIPQAAAQNFATLVVARFFSGGCVTLLANTAASIIPDVWDDDHTRSLPVAIYILCYLVGSTLGPPVFAGILSATDNWRWIFYAQLIIYGALFPFFYFTVHETRGNVILASRARQLRKKTGQQIYTPSQIANRSILRNLGAAAYRPLYLQFTEPVLMASTLWSAFSFGTVYLFTQSVEQVYSAIHSFDSITCGYVQISIVVGEVLGFFASLYGTRLYFQSAPRNTECPGRPIPEARLYVSIFGSFVGMTGGMFFYAWTSYPFLPWIAPSIGLAMVGFGIQTIISAVADYVEDAYAVSNHAGSAISAVAAGENVVAGLLPLATKRMYEELGFQWASSLLGFLAMVLSFAPILLVWRGRWFRERSPFMESGGQSYERERSGSKS